MNRREKALLFGPEVERREEKREERRTWRSEAGDGAVKPATSPISLAAYLRRLSAETVLR